MSTSLLVVLKQGDPSLSISVVEIYTQMMENSKGIILAEWYVLEPWVFTWVEYLTL